MTFGWMEAHTYCDPIAGVESWMDHNAAELWIKH